MSDHSAILLYDGACGFCERSVQFVLTHERRRHTLRFATIQSAVGTEVHARHPELASVDSVIWYEPAATPNADVIHIRSAAGLRVLRYLGGGWAALGVLGALVPRVIRDWTYDLIAHHRHQLVRTEASCLLPTPEQRKRFIA